METTIIGLVAAILVVGAVLILWWQRWRGRLPGGPL